MRPERMKRSAGLGVWNWELVKAVIVDKLRFRRLGV